MRLPTRSVALAELNDTELATTAFEGRLAAFGCKGVVEPDFHEYGKIMDACCEAVRPVTDELGRRRFQLWLLTASADLAPERWANYPNFELAKKARELEIIAGSNVQGEYLRHGKIRKAGLFSVPFDRSTAACRFINADKQSLLILSNETASLSGTGLAATFRAIDYHHGDEVPGSFKVLRHPYPNFLALGLLLCPEGAVIVKTNGGFDDKYRCVGLVYDPLGPVADVFTAAIGSV